MFSKRDTRQQILTEAFLLYEDLCNSRFSLSELAARVGISKTAIFRHFKNKDALMQAMTETVFHSFADVINAKNFFFSRKDFEHYSFEEFSDFIDTVLSFFIENKGYFGFALNSGLITKNADEPLFKLFRQYGVIFSDEYIKSADLNRFFRAYFCTESIIFFLARRFCILKNSPANMPEYKNFKNTVIDILWNGIASGDKCISAERKEELDKLCEVKVPEANDETRFFMAFTELFNEYGIEGITVERISEKLNLAKSSLYSYFNNKEEFISKMLSSELEIIMTMLSEKLQNAESIEETAYMLLLSEKNYLEQRPFVLTIHSWASQQGFNVERMSDHGKHEIDEKIAVIQNKGFELKKDISMRTFLGWVSSAIGTLKIYFNIPAENTDYIGNLFDLICFGVSKSINK